jgi:hypothetical protein
MAAALTTAGTLATITSIQQLRRSAILYPKLPGYCSVSNKEDETVGVPKGLTQQQRSGNAGEGKAVLAGGSGFGT